jgi:hypothetical protein
MQYCFYFLPGLVMGRLVDTQQYKPIFYGATTIYPCSLILAAQITQYWQAVLVQGVFFVGRLTIDSPDDLRACVVASCFQRPLL